MAEEAHAAAKKRGIIQSQSQNFIACCLMERRCDHGGKPMAEEAHAAANKKEESYNPSHKISLPAVLWKEGVSTEVNNGGRSPCGDEKQEESYKPSRKISLPTFFLKKVGGVGESGALPYPGEQPGTTRRSSEWFCCE